MNRFVILAAPRTGSNLLCTLLNSHEDILCHHELFNPSGIFYALDRRDRPADVQQLADRDGDPLGFLERIWYTGREHACVGFKWTRGQNETVFDHVRGDPGIGKVVLRRRNRIKAYLSYEVAVLTGQWEVYKEADLVQRRSRIRVDPSSLRAQIEAVESFYDALERSLEETEQPWIGATYEELLTRGEQRRLLEFLGVDGSGPLQAASVKQNPTDLRQVVENFDELAAALGDSVLGEELRDRGS